MQAYGFVIGNSSSLGPIWEWSFAMFNIDGVTRLPKNYRSVYDNYYRHSSVFCRIRYTMSELVNNYAKYPIITQGSIFLRKDPTAFNKQWKDGDRVFESSMTYVAGYGYCCAVTITEYEISGDNKSNVQSRTRRAGSGWVSISARPPFTEDAFELNILRALPIAMAALNRASFGSWVPRKTTLYETGTPSPPMVSEYGGAAWEHFEMFSITGRPNTYRARSAAQAAYDMAAASLPEITSNGIANIGELASAFAAILRRDVRTAGKLIGSAWLAYRYAYTTSVSDCREIKQYVDRILTLSSGHSGYIRSHGYCTEDGWTYHCVIKVAVDDILPLDLKTTLDQFGLELNAVNAWDMVPYSFIVDWFIPVSDALQNWESHWKSRSLPVKECWISITSPTGDCFVRSPYSWDNVAPTFRVGSVADKTLFMRIADAIALLWK